MNLRPASEADLPALIDLARLSWKSAYEGTAPTEFVREWLARDFERDWYPKYWPTMTVAESAGVILGVVQPMKDEINGLWVDPAAQGRGVGSALLLHAEGEIARAGLRRVWLTCSGFNVRAQRFYLARGYRRTGSVTKARTSGVTEEIITFERELR
jgi:ribosomal protein S18 acetylase RimI-like enzyme